MSLEKPRVYWTEDEECLPDASFLQRDVDRRARTSFRTVKDCLLGLHFCSNAGWWKSHDDSGKVAKRHRRQDLAVSAQFALISKIRISRIYPTNSDQPSPVLFTKLLLRKDQISPRAKTFNCTLWWPSYFEERMAVALSFVRFKSAPSRVKQWNDKIRKWRTTSCEDFWSCFLHLPSVCAGPAQFHCLFSYY